MRIIEINFKNKEPICIEFKVFPKNITKGRIVSFDKYKLDTKYNDISFIANPNADNIIQLKLPVHPLNLVIALDIPEDVKYKYSIKKLKQEIDKINLDKKDVEFINFALFFSENYKILKTNELYHSDNGNFHIKYVDRIKNSTTPARINCLKNLIEISKERINDLTVPQIFLILLHEYSHCHKNKKPSDEKEADYNAIKYYFALNFSENEAQKGLAKVFLRKPTEKNFERYNLIKNLLIKRKRI